MSVCVLDMLVCSILGRPSSTSVLRSQPKKDFSSNLAQTDRMDVALFASYKVTGIIDEITTKLYAEKTVSTDAAEKLLQELKQWSKELPGTLQRPSGPVLAQAQEDIVGSLNVACLYYFTATLVTRPFLISTLTADLRSGESSNPPSQEDSVHSQLASACVDSAVYLTQACLEFHRVGLLLDSMCIMK